MNATEMGSLSRRMTSTWRELGRLTADRLAMVLGGAIAVLAGVVTYVLRAFREGSIAAFPAQAAYLVAFGALGLVGYAICRENARNGAIVAAIAGLALLVLAGGAAGLLSGLLLAVAGVWCYAKAA